MATYSSDPPGFGPFLFALKMSCADQPYLLFHVSTSRPRLLLFLYISWSKRGTEATRTTMCLRKDYYVFARTTMCLRKDYYVFARTSIIICI